MTLRFIDTHCHLDFETFEKDRDEVIARALDVGIERIIIPAINLETSRKAIALAEKYPIFFAAVGIHPTDLPAPGKEEEVISELAKFAAHKKVVAIGEIGLDYHWMKAKKTYQQFWLNLQLSLAASLRLPVILHNRESTGDLLPILRQWINNEILSDLQNRAGTLHSFSGTLEDAKEAIDSGFFIGFTGPVTYKNSTETQRVASTIPLDRILIETDSPFLSPIPKRGKRNEPQNVRYIAEKIAELRSIPLEALAQATSLNAKNLFKFG